MVKLESYVCSKCGVSGSNRPVWGPFYYILDDKTKVNFRPLLALCNECNKFVAAENENITNELFSRNEARCLSCGSNQFMNIEPVNIPRDRLLIKAPFRTTMIHPNCGGRIYFEHDTPYLFYPLGALEIQYFDKEGRLIKQIQ